MDVGLLPSVPDEVEYSAVDLAPFAMVSSSTSIRQRPTSCHLVTSKGAVLFDADFSIMVAPFCPPGPTPAPPFRFGGGYVRPPPRARLPDHATKRPLNLGGRICHLNLAGVLS